MKKNIIKNKFYTMVLLLAVCAISAPVFSNEYAEAPVPSVAPKWEEFCEIGYENAKVYDESSIFNLVIVIKAERVKQTYWANRREAFEKGLQACNSMTHVDKSACYANIREAETQKNQIYTKERKNIINSKVEIFKTSRPL